MDKQGEQQYPVRLFYSYAHEDEKLREQLEKHLMLLQRQGLITTWHDRQIFPGSDWAYTIDQHLKTAQIILLLISSDFLASDYCYSIEMAYALERHRAGEARVVPVILRSVDMYDAPFVHLLSLPYDAKPVMEWENQDAAFLNIAQGIRAIIGDLRHSGGTTWRSSVSSETMPSSLLEVKQSAQIGIQGEQNTSTLHQGSSGEVGPSKDKSRQSMLERVHTTWIKGLLDQSLYGEAIIALEMREQSSAVANPWSSLVQELGQFAQSPSSGTRIIQIYDTAGGELLILGEPGAGKTTLLLELTRELLHRAQLDSTLPMPVVFNLSSWIVKWQSFARPSASKLQTDHQMPHSPFEVSLQSPSAKGSARKIHGGIAMKQLPLAEWMISELITRYYIPPHLAKLWVTTDQVLPLLDGLDEVAREYRRECIKVINGYRLEHGLAPMVVCSRSSEYLAQGERIQLRNAVVVQPLTLQQADLYLSTPDRHLEKIRKILKGDPILQELVTTPLMLNVLILAYRDTHVDDIVLSRSPEKQRQQLFDAYVKRMLARRGHSPIQYESQKTILWLAWLAKQLVQNKQTEFHIDQIRLDWLPENRLIGFCSTYFATRSFGYLSVIFGFLFGLCFRWLVGVIEPNLRIVFVLSILIGFVPAVTLIEEIVLSLFGELDPNGLTVWLFGDPMSDIPPRKVSFEGVAGRLIGCLTSLIAAWIIWWTTREIDILVAMWFYKIVLWSFMLCSVVSVAWFDKAYKIDHFILSCFLWISGVAPFRYIHFLDYVVERILLRKTDGHYIFVHRLLRDYFAALVIPSNDNKAKKRGTATVTGEKGGKA